MTTVEHAQAPKNQNIAKNEKGHVPLWAKITAGVGALATAGTVGFLAHGNNESSVSSARPVAAGEATPGSNSGHEITSKTPELTLSQEAVDAQKRFDANIDTANASVRHGLDIHGLGYGDFFHVGAGPSSKNMSPEQIVARDMAKQIWLKTNPDRTQAKSDAAIISPIGSAPYESMASILDSPNPTDHDSVDVDLVRGEPYHFTSGTHDGITSHGDTWLISVSPAQSGGTYVNIFEWYENPDGSGGEYLHVKTDSKKDTPGFATTYTDILPAVMHN